MLKLIYFPVKPGITIPSSCNWAKSAKLPCNSLKSEKISKKLKLFNGLLFETYEDSDPRRINDLCNILSVQLGILVHSRLCTIRYST